MANNSAPGEAGSLLERLARSQAALDRERASAPALCSELLALSGEQQEPRLRQDPRFHTWGMCEVLLERSLMAATAATAPDTARPESGRLARLALTAAELLDEALHCAPVVQDLEARAWACLGDSKLQADDLAGAEEALRQAAQRLAHGTGDLLVEARLLEFEAAVRSRQGRRNEAAALLQQAESRYREVNEHHLAARTQLQRDQVLQQGETRLRGIVFEPG